MTNMSFVSLSVITRGKTATGTAPRSFEHAHKVKIIVHDLDGNVDIIGSCVGKLLCQLLCRAHLIDHNWIGHGALPRGQLRHGQAAARLRYRAALVERRYKLRRSSFISDAER